MPYVSEKQRRWAHTKEGRKAIDTKEWDKASKGKDLPEEASSADQEAIDKAKRVRKISRDTDPFKGKRRGGYHSTPKGKKGYSRKEKHKGQSVGNPLTPEDETYRGIHYPLATIAKLNWSSHKSETFKDTGEKGEHPAWGLKSIIDRGVKPHEKQNGAKKIEPGSHQTQQRKTNGKKFKAYSSASLFTWKVIAYDLPSLGRPCGEGEDSRIGHCNPNLSPEGGGQQQAPDFQAGPGDWELPPGGEEESILHLIEDPKRAWRAPEEYEPKDDPRQYYQRTLMGFLTGVKLGY